MPFSCRERAANMCQTPNDLAREAASCNAGLGRNFGTDFICAS
jgi:hypothetical protein